MTKIEKHSKIDISNADLGISDLYGHGEILSSVTPDQQSIFSRIKERKLQTL